MTPAERRERLFEAEKIGLRMVNDTKLEKPPDLHKAIGRRIFDLERDRLGSRFFAAGNEAFVLDGAGRAIHPITHEDKFFCAWLNVRYGLSKSDKLTRLVVEFLHDRTLTYAEKLSTSRFSHYDRITNTLYIDANDGQVWRLNGEAPPQLIMNGQDVFFLPNQNVSLSEADVAPHGILHKELVDSLNYAAWNDFTPVAQRHLFGAWLHLLAFGDWLTNAKPLLMIEGSKRAGKSMAIKRIATMLNGHSSPMILSEEGESDFAVQLLHSAPIAHIDNQDRLIKWLPDAVAAYCTDGVWRKRKLRTDGDMFEIRPTCFVAVSSADPKSFRRDDVADRSIVIRLERYRDGEGGNEEELVDRVVANRNKLVGEWLYNLNGILAELPTTTVEKSQSRMVGWERIFTAYRKVMEFDDKLDVLALAQAERVEFTMEDEPAIDMIDRWLEKTENPGRAVTGKTLWMELAELAAAGTPLGERSAFIRVHPSEVGFCRWLTRMKDLVMSKFDIQSWQNTDPRDRTKRYCIRRYE